jgi:hypothetical protein
MIQEEVQVMEDDDIRTAIEVIAAIAKVRLLTDEHVADFWLLHEDEHNRKARERMLAGASP